MSEEPKSPGRMVAVSQIGYDVPAARRLAFSSPTVVSMSPDSVTASSPAKPTFAPLRAWPFVLLTALMWALHILPPFAETITIPLVMARFFGPIACAVLILLAWMFFSRADWREKFTGLVGLTMIGLVTTILADYSVRPIGILMFAVPWGFTAFALTLAAMSRTRPTHRTRIALAVAIPAFGFWDLVRIDEIRGDFVLQRSWRWEKSAEDQTLEKLALRKTASDTPGDMVRPRETIAAPEWPEFRGPDRSGRQPGIALAEDWEAQPPTEIWRIPVGPAWSSFVVAGNRLFTQEQRGELEVVTCYDAGTGHEVWEHQSTSRFWEAIGGAGPRATPTLSEGDLFAMGASGLLHCLNPVTGEQIWQANIADVAERKPPTWGFSSSPLVTGDVVIVHAGGANDKGVLAFDRATGKLRWSAPDGDHTYSSPHLATVAGKTCVLQLSNKGLSVLDPGSGDVLGTYTWKWEGYRVVQPLVVESSDVLIGTAMGEGTRRIHLSFEGGTFSVEEAWHSQQMSPYYNDYVAHRGFLYGFDNNIFACVDLTTGKRKWKRGRYGNGQVLLLPAADQLLVVSEDGEIVLLRATPERWTELTRFPALEGRTWNHPVLVGDRLYVRNAAEAVCFQMPLRGAEKTAAQETATQGTATEATATKRPVTSNEENNP